MNQKLLVYTKSLKDFLRLFDDNLSLKNLGLGDTWHPSDGYVDEQILEGRNTVKELLDFPYDFIGLVYFECIISGLKVCKIPNDRNFGICFEVTAKDYRLRDVSNKLIEMNAYLPHHYEFALQWVYEA